MMFHKTTEIAMVQIKTANIAMILHMNTRTPLSSRQQCNQPSLTRQQACSTPYEPSTS